MLSILVGTALCQITSSAAHYQLKSDAERKRSARNLRQLFYGLQRVLQPDVFVEAGANDAQASIDIRRLVPNANIVAFEANPFNYEIFSKKTNFAEHNITYQNIAIADSVGTIPFKLLKQVGDTVVDPVSERNSILPRSDAEAAYDEVLVPSTTLDDYFSATRGSFSLWIDVEGASRQVLTGAENVLANTLSLIIEVESKAYWADQWLYHDVCSHLMSNGFVPVARDYEYRRQFNIVFLKDTTFSKPEIVSELEYYQSALVGSGTQST